MVGADAHPERIDSFHSSKAPVRRSPMFAISRCSFKKRAGERFGLSTRLARS